MLFKPETLLALIDDMTLAISSCRLIEWVLSHSFDSKEIQKNVCCNSLYFV